MKKTLHWIIVFNGVIGKKWRGFEENVILNYCIWWRNMKRMHHMVGFRRRCCIELLYLKDKWRKNTSSGGVSKKMLHWIIVSDGEMKMLHWIIVSDGEMKKEYIKWWGFKEKCCIDYCIWWRNEEKIHQVVGFQRKMLHWIIVSNGEIKKEYIKWWGFEEKYCIELLYLMEKYEKNPSSGGFRRKYCIE